MARYEEHAEAAYDAMYDARPPAAKDHYEDARAYLTKAIAMAQGANLTEDVARLTARRRQITEIYNRQFRSVGYS
ncbi:MAG TPA: hypothetical protein VN362_22380 [Xanthobacteraceae bacterium]|nr:hypothetical protein [Xanthobacteraceae bacterium]